MKTDIGLHETSRATLATALNAILGDAYVLYTKTRNYHWNVIGPHFAPLHALFQAQYEALDAEIDEIAERVRMLGGHALGTLQELCEVARLEEQPGEYPDARGMLMNLLADHDALAAQLREDVARADELGDAGTADLLTQSLRAREKDAWMLRATLSEVDRTL